MKSGYGVDGPLICVRPPGWTGRRARPFADVLEWAQRAEALGFDGLFVGDRLLAQADQREHVVYGASMLDAVVTLSAIAARTTRIRLGPLVLVFPYRHPVQLAKTIASLDVVASGRVVVGAGIGWNQREFDTLGVSPRGRGARFEEQLSLVRGLWRGEAVSHTGAPWPLDDVAISPLPVQQGGPPIWMASFSPGQALDWTGSLPGPALRVLDRVGRLADAWVPLIYSASGKRRLDADVLAVAWQHVLAGARRVGRDRGDIDFVFSDWCYVLEGPGSRQRCEDALRSFFSGDWQDALRTYSIGTRSEILEKIARHVAGIDRVDAYILTPLSDEPEQLERFAGLAEGLRATRERPS